jgi:hypothetical protein
VASGYLRRHARPPGRTDGFVAPCIPSLAHKPPAGPEVSGWRLSTLDIDHMFPWAVWPCSDLWNVLPTHREVNQKLKRDRLPSAAALARAESRIIGWWQQAYLGKTDTPLPDQFLQQARTSLPAFSTAAPGDIFASVTLQRIRLRHDQQAPEWGACRERAPRIARAGA